MVQDTKVLPLYEMCGGGKYAGTVGRCRCLSFNGYGQARAFWEVSALADMPVEQSKAQASESKLEVQVELPLMTKGEHVVQDYATTGLLLKAHPVSFVRDHLDMLNIRTTMPVNEDSTAGQIVKVAGLVLVRQRPGTAGGVCFITTEDERVMRI